MGKQTKQSVRTVSKVVFQRKGDTSITNYDVFSKDKEVQRIRNQNGNKLDATVQRLKVDYSMG